MASTRRRRTGRFPSSPAAGACASRSPRCSSPRLTCCCSTSRPITSISRACCGSSTISKTCPSTILVISHDRDLLDDVADHILHLDRAKLTLWSGGYTSFERQRREQQALQGKAIKKQEERRAHLQAFVDRFRASATKATQAQSRLKMLAKMEPIAAIVDEDVLPFRWPPIARKLSPPIVAMEKVSVGYGERAVLSRLDLTLSNDDRIGLLGANGNGKSTFAKLIGGRLAPMAGQMVRANKLERRLLRPAPDRRTRRRAARPTAMSPSACAASRSRRSAAAPR